MPHESKTIDAAAYGGHPFALTSLGQLLAARHGGDIAKWRELDPGRGDIATLFDKVLDHHADDTPLLEIVACSIGSAPVAMLADLGQMEEGEARERLAHLQGWQLVEFSGGDADQHALIRRRLRHRIEDAARSALLGRMARWYGAREIRPNPQTLDELRPRLRAVEHALEAGDAEYATDLFYRKPAEESHYTTGGWLRRHGHLHESIRLNSQTAELLERLINQEGRRELRNGLAVAHNNRGVAFKNLGRLEEAIEDYDRAIAIFQELVEQDGRRELRNDLATTHNNRGNALADLGRLDEAMEDYDRAIAIYQELVEQEGRRELRNDRAKAYNNRGNALAELGRLDEAIEDYGRAVVIYQELVEQEGRRE